MSAPFVPPSSRPTHAHTTHTHLSRRTQKNCQKPSALRSQNLKKRKWQTKWFLFRLDSAPCPNGEAPTNPPSSKNANINQRVPPSHTPHQRIILSFSRARTLSLPLPPSNPHNRPKKKNSTSKKSKIHNFALLFNAQVRQHAGARGCGGELLQVPALHATSGAAVREGAPPGHGTMGGWPG